MIATCRPLKSNDHAHKIYLHPFMFTILPFLSWTAATFNHRTNSITTTSVVLAGIHWMTWTNLLPSLKFSCFRHCNFLYFDLNGRGYGDTPLLVFLSRHPIITYLTLPRVIAQQSSSLSSAIQPFHEAMPSIMSLLTMLSVLSPPSPVV